MWVPFLSFGAKRKGEGVEEKALHGGLCHMPPEPQAIMLPCYCLAAAALKCPANTKSREPLANGDTHARLLQQESYDPHAYYSCRLQHCFCIMYLLSWNLKFYLCLDLVCSLISNIRNWSWFINSVAWITSCTYTCCLFYSRCVLNATAERRPIRSVHENSASIKTKNFIWYNYIWYFFAGKIIYDIYFNWNKSGNVTWIICYNHESCTCLFTELNMFRDHSSNGK